MLWGGSCEGRKFREPWEDCSPWRDYTGEGDYTGRISAPKQGRAATGLWKARWRVAYTEGQNHHTEFPNLRYPSDSEGGSQVLKFKL